MKGGVVGKAGDVLDELASATTEVALDAIPEEEKT